MIWITIFYPPEIIHIFVEILLLNSKQNQSDFLEVINNNMNKLNQ